MNLNNWFGWIRTRADGTPGAASVAHCFASGDSRPALCGAVAPERERVFDFGPPEDIGASRCQRCSLKADQERKKMGG